MPKYNSLPVWWKLITRGNDDKAAFGLSVAAAVASLEVISQALPGFFNILVANFLPALAEIFPIFSKKTRQSFGLKSITRNSH